MTQVQRPTGPKLATRLVRWLLLSGAVIYLIACLVAAYYQRALIYHPRIRTSQQVDEAAQSTRLERWCNQAGQPIGMKRLSRRQPADGQVLITYGNGSWAVGCAHYADDIQNVAALDVFILEYPGYADRAGSPSQKSIFRAAEDAFQSLDAHKPVYLLGESLGSGVASYLAGTYPRKVAGLILLSPFNRLTDVAQHRLPLLPARLMLLDRFPSEDYLRDYHGPVGIVVDGLDKAVPSEFGIKLYDRYAGPKRLWNFPDGHHVSIMESPSRFWGEVIDFWRTSQGAENNPVAISAE